MSQKPPTLSNAPQTLPAEAEKLLRAIREREYTGRGLRMSPSKERALLKKRGLIYSRPPNANVAMRAIGGHQHAWFTTTAGRELLEYLGPPDPDLE